MNKNLFCLLLILLAFAVVLPSAALAENDQKVNLPVGMIFGDINQDGLIDQLDLNMIESNLSGNLTFTAVQAYAADVNGDKYITQVDYSILSQYLNGGDTREGTNDDELILIGLVLGDVNSDGAINKADLIMGQSIFLEIIEPSAKQKYITDINGDGIVALGDLIKMQGYVDNKENTSDEIVNSGYCGAAGNEKNVRWTLNKEGLLTISGTGAMADYAAYDAPWYEQRESVLSVLVETGVTNVGNSICYNHTELKNAIISNGVNSIGDSAFGGCDRIESIIIPSSVETIRAYAFGNCVKLDGVILPSGIKTVENQAFSCCASLKSITIPGGVDVIEWGTFEYCSSLTSVIIENGVTRISDYAFGWCSSLSSLTTPASVTEISSVAFSGCDKLTSAGPLGGNYSYKFSWTKEIPSNAFCNLANLASVTLPSSVETIRAYAFGNCVKLDGVILPSGIKTVENQAFSCCASLKSITIPGGVDVIEWGTFEYCSSLTSVIIENGVTRISDYVFAGCSNLSSLTMSASVTLISSTAFYSCDYLTDVYYNGTEHQWNTQSWSKDIPEFLKATIHIIEQEQKQEQQGYTIKFDPNGGSGNMSPLTVVNKSVALPPCSFTPYAGRKFKCWDIERKEYRAGDACTILHDVTAVAHWILDFDETLYRASHLTNSKRAGISQTTDNYMYSISTPSKILVDSGKKNGLETSLNIWRGVTIMGDAVTDPSSVLNIPVESKDIYSAIIMDMLKTSASLDYLDMKFAEGIKDGQDFVDNVTDAIKAGIGLELNTGDITFAEWYRMLPEKDKPTLIKIIQETVEDELKEKQPDLVDLGDTFEEITNSLKLLEVASDIFDYYERVLSCIMIANQCKQYADSITMAYQEALQTNNIALQRALFDCKQMIEAENEDILFRAIAAQSTVVGKKALQYVFKEVYWKETKNIMLQLHPGVFMFMVAYSFGKLTANALFNTDGIKKQFTSLNAVREVEEIFFSVNQRMKNRFLTQGTVESARAYLSSFDLVYRGFNEDCVQAWKFIDIAEHADWIDGLFGGNKMYEDKKNTITAFQVDYSVAYDMLMREWINYLSEDYPDSTLEAYYRAMYQTVPYGRLMESIDVACPVDIYIYNRNKELVASVVGEIVSCKDKNIMIARDGDKKEICFYESADYSIEYVGTDIGDMDVTVNEYDEDENIVRTVNYNSIDLANNSIYTSEIVTNDTGEMNYELTNHESVVIGCDFDSMTVDSQAHSISVDSAVISRRGVVSSSTQAYSGERLELSAVIPDGCTFLRWESLVGNPQIEDLYSRAVKTGVSCFATLMSGGTQTAKCQILPTTSITSSSTTFVMTDTDATIRAVLQMAPVMVSQLEKDADGNITANIHCTINDCSAYCAFYDVVGKMVDLRIVSLSTESINRPVFNVTNDIVAEVRMFVLDSNLVPQCLGNSILLEGR